MVNMIKHVFFTGDGGVPSLSEFRASSSIDNSQEDDQLPGTSKQVIFCPD